MPSASALHGSRRTSAFTLAELLLVVAVVVVLAALLVPVLARQVARAKAKSRAVRCMDNGRQMTVAWLLYTEANRGRVPKANGANPWVDGRLDLVGGAANWNPRDLTNSPLWQYCGRNAALWRCPADPSTVEANGATLPRVRSISMNAWFDGDDVEAFGPGFRVYRTVGDLVDPGPANTWLFIDEREDAINDGGFIVGMRGFPDQPKLWVVVDFPAAFHDQAAGVAFADGHSEIRRWKDRRTMPAPRKDSSLQLNMSSPGNPDAYWLMDHSTRRP